MTASGVGLLFPGQGAQHVGMGEDLAERFPSVRRLWEAADDTLGFSLSRICWAGPPEELTDTAVAQPALFVHSFAVWSLLAEGDSRLIRGAAGHSLGEFSAYAAAESLSFEDGLRVVRRRGELMAAAGERRPGTMAAVLGLDDEVVEMVCRDVSDEAGVVVPANFNAPGQVVISGDREAVWGAGELLREAGARRVLPLKVSGAFHSPLMASAADGLREELDRLEFTTPCFPIFSNVTGDAVNDADGARALLLDQLTSPVRWVACVQAMIAEGMTHFLELGPGNVLAGLVRRIATDTQVSSLGTADQMSSFLERGVQAWS